MPTPSPTPTIPTTAIDPLRTPRLQLLGSFRLTLGRDDLVLPVASQRVVTALCLRGRVSRVRLAGLLWPETRQSQAQTNLRHALWRLSRAAPGVQLVSCIGDGLELSPDVTSDVGALLAEAHRPRADTLAVPPAWLEDLLRVEAVELLPDWDDAWLDPDRERLRQLRLHVLDDWAHQLTEAGDYGLALQVALCALQADNLRESAHRAVIRVHRAEGNVHEARRAYAVCRSVLSAEIGVDPSPVTAALVP